MKLLMTIGSMLGILAAMWLGLSSPGATSAEPANDVEALLAEAGNIDGLKTLLAQRDGEMVVAGYLNGADSSDLHHLRSVTKSVVSLLVGIAIDRGDLESVGLTLGELIPHRLGGLPAARRDLTLHQLLTMSAGLEWGEQDVSEFNRWRSSRDPVAYYLRRAQVAAPGESFSYCSAASHLLSVVLTEVTGVDTLAYARRYLFEPLGIDRVRWGRHNDGIYDGSASLELRARDTFKLGELVLAGGRWQGRQIVTQAWLDRALSPHIEVGEGMSYGYQWWLPTGEPTAVYMAQGHAGQSLAIIPEYRVIVGTHCRWRNLGRSSAEQTNEIGSFIKSWLVPLLIPEARQDLGDS